MSRDNRSAAFTPHEVAILLEEVLRHRDQLFGGRKGKDDLYTKRCLWQDIARSMAPSSPCGLRHWKGIRKKWQDLSSRAKKKTRQARGASRLTADEERVISIIGETADGWVDDGGMDEFGEFDDEEPPASGAAATHDGEEPSASGANSSMPGADGTPPLRPRRQPTPAGRAALMRAGVRRPSLARCTCSEALVASEKEKLGVLRKMEAHLQRSNDLQQEILNVKREKLKLQRRQLALAEARSTAFPNAAPVVLPQDPDLAVCKEEVSSGQQERNTSQVQREPEIPQASKQQELLRRPGEAEVSMKTSLVAKSEDNDNGETGNQATSSSSCSESDTDDSDNGEDSKSSESEQTHSSRSHTDKGSFGCTECGKMFHRKEHLKMHSKMHTGEKSFNCKVCGTGYSQLGHLKSHMRTHTGKR